jgi:hypothetical protein
MPSWALSRAGIATWKGVPGAGVARVSYAVAAAAADDFARPPQRAATEVVRCFRERRSWTILQ